MINRGGSERVLVWCRSKVFKSRSSLFDVEAEDYDDLAKTLKDFEPYQALWVTADVWIKKKKEWLDGGFLDIDADTLEQVVGESFKTMFKQARFFTQKDVAGCAAVATKLRDEIEEFKPCVPVAKALRNLGMRDRHWEDLSQKIADVNGGELVQLAPENLTLRVMTEKYKMSSVDVMPSVMAVAEVSNKEFGIEKMLDKMLGLWQPMEYGVISYRKHTSTPHHSLNGQGCI